MRIGKRPVGDAGHVVGADGDTAAHSGNHAHADGDDDKHAGCQVGETPHGVTARRTGVFTSRRPERVQDGPGDHAVSCQTDGDDDRCRPPRHLEEEVGNRISNDLLDIDLHEVGPVVSPFNDLDADGPPNKKDPVQVASRRAILVGRERLTRGQEPLSLVKTSSDRDLARTTAAIDA